VTSLYAHMLYGSRRVAVGDTVAPVRSSAR
jgi:hypothetical protein